MSKVTKNTKSPISRLLRVGREGVSLDTREQVVQNSFSWENKSVNRPGEELPPKSVNSLKIIARRISQRNALMSKMIDYANQVNSSNLNHYWNVFNCGMRLKQLDNKYLIPETRCGSRLCPNCSRIRTAKVCDEFLPLIEKGKKYASLTLTARNDGLFEADDIQKKVDFLYKILSNIRQKAQRELKKGLLPDISAIISFEVVPAGWKKDKKTGKRYFGPTNPHFHIFGDQELLAFLKKEWLKKVDCTEINQKYIPIDGENEAQIKKSVLEVVKYSLKSFVSLSKNELSANLRGIDDLVTILKGRRRLMTWGVFYNNKIDKVENANIEDLCDKKQPYLDIPIKDKGELKNMVDARGNIVKKVPEFSIDIVWELNLSSCNFFYFDELSQKKLSLFDENKPPDKKYHFYDGLKFYEIEKNKKKV